MTTQLQLLIIIIIINCTARCDHKRVFVFSCKVPYILVRFCLKNIFFDIFRKIFRYQIYWNSLQWEPSSTRTARRADRHDEANSRFSQLLRTRQTNLTKLSVDILHRHYLAYAVSYLRKFRKRKAIEITISVWGSGSNVRRRWRKNTAGRKQRQSGVYVAVDSSALLEFGFQMDIHVYAYTRSWPWAYWILTWTKFSLHHIRYTGCFRRNSKYSMRW